MSKNIGVLGAGSWGSTLATLLAEQGNSVTLWEFDPQKASELATWRSLNFFHYVNIPKDVVITSDLAQSVENKEFLIFAVPSHTMQKVVEDIRSLPIDLSSTIAVSATKGIESVTLKRMSEIIAEGLPQLKGRIVVLSGPTHAEEVAQKIATAATAASENQEAAKLCQELFTSSFFRIYTHDDVIGVETGGALKNIFAIAAGICDGLGLGDNTKAAMITRGIREMIALGIKIGGKPATFFGLTGIGDLVVTCFSRHSRNHAIGEKIGKGKSLAQSEQELIMVAEGVKTALSAYELAKRYNMELPIIEKVYQILYENKSPLAAVRELMLRDAKSETKLSIGELTI